MTKARRGPPAIYPLPYSPGAADYFARLRHLPLPVLLASGDSGHRAARYDILSADPKLILRTSGWQTEITSRQSRVKEYIVDDPFAVLASRCPIGPDDQACPLPFSGGAIGYFAYELLHPDYDLDPGAKAPIGLPDMLVGLYDWALVLDHQLKSCQLVCRDEARERSDELLQLLQDPVGAEPAPFRLLGTVAANFSRQDYYTLCQRIIEYIHAGDCYQVNLAQCFSAACAGDSWSAFQALQDQARAPFAAFLEDGPHSVLSFSPERFLQVANKSVLTQPIKGTRPRGDDPARDLDLRRALEASAKDRAENLMIVDLLRNDLGKVCVTGSIVTEKLFETQSFANVHHLVSTITGKLATAEDVFPLLRACFPGGSVTGTPKLRAMQIINELETRPRSVYCGAIGYIDQRGNMDSNIAIRTLVRNGDQIHCWGGGGIVADSRADEEYQETFDKISLFLDGMQGQ